MTSSVGNNHTTRCCTWSQVERFRSRGNVNGRGLLLGVRATCQPWAVILDGLDAEQRAAAQAVRGPVAIIAGAGTGKTRAITHRIAYGVQSGVQDPRRSLAVTFTTKAAGEMRARLAALGVPGVQARTFHSAALRQLRHFWPRLSDREFPRIMPSKIGLVSEALARSGVSAQGALVRDVAGDIEWAKVNMYEPHTVASLTTHSFALTPAMTAQVLTEYAELTAARGVMDFEDVLLVLAGALQAHESMAADVRAAYRWFTVDEFQDVNPVQWLLLTQWLGDRDDLCVVGDPDQTIYSFTGASSKYLNEFSQTFPHATTVNLVRCYRCTPQIVSWANGVLNSAAPRLISQNPPGPEPVITSYPDDVAEATAVAEQIARAKSGGESLQEIAILFRINAQSIEIENALAAAAIPYVVKGADRFFDAPEIKEAITRLRGAAHESKLHGPLGDQVRAVLTAMQWSPQAPESTGAVRQRWENLAALVALADERAATMDLPGLVRELDERAAADHAPSSQGVTVASLHAAKGMEWDRVFIVGASEGLIPLSHAESAEERAEERRLLYVGLTRARRHLHVSWARSREPGGRAQRELSRFLAHLVPQEASTARATVLKGERKKRGVASCRSCGKGLVTAAERTVGRCRTCPATYDQDFFDRLRAWRMDKAQEMSVPAFVVFTDATLIAIAEKLPANSRDLLAIPGVGERKREMFGEDLLALVEEQLHEAQGVE